jgi:hypothetical protein
MHESILVLFVYFLFCLLLSHLSLLNILLGIVLEKLAGTVPFGV